MKFVLCIGQGDWIYNEFQPWTDLATVPQLKKISTKMDEQCSSI
jgi:hypothetical protein